jgi:hypothetical protein
MTPAWSSLAIVGMAETEVLTISGAPGANSLTAEDRRVLKILLLILIPIVPLIRSVSRAIKVKEKDTNPTS